MKVHSSSSWLILAEAKCYEQDFAQASSLVEMSAEIVIIIGSKLGTPESELPMQGDERYL